MAQRKTKTISIPPDLDKQLDQFSKENWSAIACEAFRIRLIQLEAMKNIGSTDAAVARLRASRERSTNEMFAAGEIAGADFAADVGEFIELERLERFRDSCGSDWGQVASQIHPRQLAKAIGGEDGETEMLDWFNENHKDQYEDSSWLEGFVQGALTKFGELREKL